jgi:hypothetical protein
MTAGKSERCSFEAHLMQVAKRASPKQTQNFWSKSPIAIL